MATNLSDTSDEDASRDIKEIRTKIHALISEYVKHVHQQKQFIPGESWIPVSGKVFGENEIQMLVSSSLDFWLTAGPYNLEFENKLKEFLGVNFAITTNSGSSANLLAISALTSEEFGDKALQPGDEIITTAVGFPTTINPILQNNLVPVFVDSHIPTYNVDANLIEESISEKTKAIMIAHTLGNPYDLSEVLRIAKKYDLWLIEDCCDALGSTYNDKLVGTFGDVATLSFYPAHHITMGEGGAVFTNNSQIKRQIESFRDWGRDCFCAPGKSNTCGKRFGWKLGDLPYGYDHKYTYSNVGYNLKITDMQAAIGLAQLERLPDFIKKRKENFKFIKENLRSVEQNLILPEHTKGSDPAWFGFPITVNRNTSFDKNSLVDFLIQKKIDSRPIFAGNIVRQPYFKNKKYRISGSLNNADLIMNSSFWIGVYPGLTEEMLHYVTDVMSQFIKSAQ